MKTVVLASKGTIDGRKDGKTCNNSVSKLIIVFYVQIFEQIAERPIVITAKMHVHK